MKTPWLIIIFFLFIVISSVLVGCWNDYQVKTISDVTKKQTIILGTAQKGNVYSITIIGKGYIDGEALITSPEGSLIYQKISGKVNFKVESDYYSPSVGIEYTPESVKSGNLQLQFQFHTF